MTINISIVGNMRDSNSTYNVFGVSASYMHFFGHWGAPSVFPVMSVGDLDRYLSAIDAVVIPGGADVNPERYRRAPGYFTGKQDPFYEYFDANILPVLLRRNIPIIGICRGFQSLAVAAGLPLRQHLAYHASGGWEDLVHDITAYSTSSGKQKTICKVNSLHHQGVYIRDTWPTNFTPLAVDGLVLESFSWNNTLAFQWHPEAISDQFSTDQIEGFFARNFPK